MRSVKAIFAKQAKDTLNNPITLLPFMIFPVVAFIMTEMVAKSNPDISNNMFVPMMAAIFAGFGLLQSSAAAIAEDIEKKSLRFLIIAGVKPHEYLLGMGGFLLLVAAVVSAAFGFIGDFSWGQFAVFFVIMFTGSAASITLGVAIGMLTKNQQAAAGVSVPIAVILGFTPMIAGFNKTVEKAAGILYTQQISAVVNDPSAGFAKPLAVIAANIAVLTVVFIVAYRKKGLKG